MLSPVDVRQKAVATMREGAATEQWNQSYLRMLDEAKPGLNEIVVQLVTTAPSLLQPFYAVAQISTILGHAWANTQSQFIRDSASSSKT